MEQKAEDVQDTQFALTFSKALSAMLQQQAISYASGAKDK